LRQGEEAIEEQAQHLASGKVREIFALGADRVLLVASDRISVFDVVLPTDIPDKGRVLTGISGFWFARTREIVPNHLLALRPDGRSSECKKLEMLPLECVVRGYLAGSGWKDYRESGKIAGHALPPGLVESDKLPGPIFTPSTKATVGHDITVDRANGAELVGEERYAQLEQVSLALYSFAADYAAERGILLADTKFELGLDENSTVAPWCLATSCSRPTPRASGRPRPMPPAARSPRSTSSRSETGPRRPVGTRPIQVPSYRPTSSPQRGSATCALSSD